MKKVVYFNPNDVENFDMSRFTNSLVKYGAAITDETERAIEERIAPYEPVHVSVLGEIAIHLLDEENAKKYYNDHAYLFDGGKFERLRRITGYLVGTLDRWNDAKKAEEAARVKHSVNSSIDDAERLAALETQAMEQNFAYGK